MGNTLVLVKGCSGAGKSTRMSHLINKLMERESTTFSAHIYKDKSVGFDIHDTLNNQTYIILGKYSRADKWQGIDAVTKHFSSSEGITQFVIETLSNNDNLTLIIEGAGTTASWRWRPIYLTQIDQANHLFSYCTTIYYQFQKHEYDSYSSRILERSGRPPNSQAMWRKNMGFLNEFKKTIIELQQLSLEERSKFSVAEFSYNEPIDHLYNRLMGC